MILGEILFFCTTTDILTSRALKAFTAFTLHYLTVEFEMKSFTLEVKPFGGKHSGKNIAEELQAILDI